jgi:SPP1 family predicted phage head-tail adaptor
MTGRVKIIRVTTEIKEGRKEPTTEVFYECWCDVQSLGTNEKYTALQAGIENTIVFKVRNCKRMKEVRKKMKEFYAEYDGTRFDIYDASPMFTDNGWVLVKCRAVA